MRKRIDTSILLIMVLFLVWGIGYIYTQEYHGDFTTDITYKPYVYRALLPTLAWIMQSVLRVSSSTSMQGFILLFSGGMLLSLYYLYACFYGKGPRAIVYSFVTSCLVFFVASFPPHVYDIPTVTLFSLSLLLLQAHKWNYFWILFPVVCFNRETSILLVAIFAWYAWERGMKPKEVVFWSIIGVGIDVAIRILLTTLFQAYPGDVVQFNFYHNADVYLDNPYIFLITLFSFLAVLNVVWGRWNHIPSLMRISFLVMLPSLILLYLLFGVALELRVFLEVVPVLTFIGMIPLEY